MDITTEINKLKQVAKQNGLLVRFRDHKTNMGDFCIFIYDKSIRKSYLVGYDGNWDGKVLTFERCLNSAYMWIKNRDKRFTKVDGKWIYKKEVDE